MNIKGKFYDESSKEIKMLYQTVISYIEIDEIREMVEMNPPFLMMVLKLFLILSL